VEEADVTMARLKVDMILRSCAFSIHTLLCKKEHEEDPGNILQPAMNKCLWYVEEQVLESEWDGSDHKFWLSKTLELMREQEIANTEDLKFMITQATVVIHKIKLLSNDFPKIFDFIAEVIES